VISKNYDFIIKFLIYSGQRSSEDFTGVVKSDGWIRSERER